MYKNMRGVTLLELMVVIVIVAILASVAYPNYRDYLDRAKRNEAKAALLQIATNQEREYLNNNQYTTDLIILGFDQDPYTTDSGAYIVDVTSADGNNFTATATATAKVSAKEQSKCRQYTVDGRGQRTSDPDTDCWTRTR